jgi:hypothetical protein
MNTPTTNTTTVDLPAPGYPMLTRMISESLLPDEKTGKETTVIWIVGSPHPLVPKVKIVRMFLDRGSVEIYSVSEDGKAGMRNRVPEHRVRFTEEAMPIDVFIEELAAAEIGDDDEEESDMEEPEASTTIASTQTNGQPPPPVS